MISDASMTSEVQGDPLGLPPIDQDFLDGLPLLTVDQLGSTFDELATIAAEQPDDRLVVSKISSLVGEVVRRGEIGTAMEIAMTMGAMACTHVHLESTANSIGQSVFKLPSLEIGQKPINSFNLDKTDDEDDEEKKRLRARYN